MRHTGGSGFLRRFRLVLERENTLPSSLDALVEYGDLLLVIAGCELFQFGKRESNGAVGKRFAHLFPHFRKIVQSHIQRGSAFMFFLVRGKTSVFVLVFVFVFVFVLVLVIGFFGFLN